MLRRILFCLALLCCFYYAARWQQPDDVQKIVTVGFDGHCPIVQRSFLSKSSYELTHGELYPSFRYRYEDGAIEEGGLRAHHDAEAGYPRATAGAPVTLSHGLEEITGQLGAPLRTGLLHVTIEGHDLTLHISEECREQMQSEVEKYVCSTAQKNLLVARQQESVTRLQAAVTFLEAYEPIRTVEVKSPTESELRLDQFTAYFGRATARTASIEGSPREIIDNNSSLRLASTCLTRTWQRLLPSAHVIFSCRNQGEGGACPDPNTKAQVSPKSNVIIICFGFWQIHNPNIETRVLIHEATHFLPTPTLSGCGAQDVRDPVCKQGSLSDQLCYGRRNSYALALSEETRWKAYLSAETYSWFVFDTTSNVLQICGGTRNPADCVSSYLYNSTVQAGFRKAVWYDTRATQAVSLFVPDGEQGAGARRQRVLSSVLGSCRVLGAELIPWGTSLELKTATAATAQLLGPNCPKAIITGKLTQCKQPARLPVPVSTCQFRLVPRSYAPRPQEDALRLCGAREECLDLPVSWMQQHLDAELSLPEINESIFGTCGNCHLKGVASLPKGYTVQFYERCPGSLSPFSWLLYDANCDVECTAGGFDWQGSCTMKIKRTSYLLPRLAGL